MQYCKKMHLLFAIAFYDYLYAAPVAVPDGGTGNTTLTAYTILCGGTQNFAPLQSVASVGSSGQPIVSNGAGSLPSFQTLPISGGGTNATSISSGVVQSNGTTLSSLGVGSSGQILKNTTGTVGWAAFTGLLQVGYTSTTALVDTSGTSIPDDDTIPQFSEGTLILSLSFTPLSASSNLLIIFDTGGTNNASAAAVMALFVDSGANAIAAAYVGQRGAGNSYSGALTYQTTSGSTSARTYQVRVGGGDLYVNGTVGARAFGGVASTYLMVIEYV